MMHSFPCQVKPSETGRCMTRCGTIHYMAPEVHHFLGHGRSADFWSFGAFAFDMMCCDFPIKNFRYKDAIRYPEFLSKEAVSLFKGLLQTGLNRVNCFLDLKIRG